MAMFSFDTILLTLGEWTRHGSWIKLCQSTVLPQGQIHWIQVGWSRGLHFMPYAQRCWESQSVKRHRCDSSWGQKEVKGQTVWIPEDFVFPGVLCP